MGVMKVQETGLKVSDLSYKHGINDAAFYKTKYDRTLLRQTEALQRHGNTLWQAEINFLCSNVTRLHYN